MPVTDEDGATLSRAIRAVYGKLVATADMHKRRRAGHGVDAADLLQEGLVGAYKQLCREMEDRPEQYAAMSFEELKKSIVCIASRVMRNKICDDHRRTYRRRSDAAQPSASADYDDRLREALDARESLRAIDAALSGPALQLYRLVLVHGQDDVPRLAASIGRSLAQTYRLLKEIRQTAHRVAGRVDARDERAAGRPALSSARVRRPNNLPGDTRSKAA